jgi:hypothetical protein
MGRPDRNGKTRKMGRAENKGEEQKTNGKTRKQMGRPDNKWENLTIPVRYTTVQ